MAKWLYKCTIDPLGVIYIGYSKKEKGYYTRSSGQSSLDRACGFNKTISACKRAVTKEFGKQDWSELTTDKE